MHTICKGLSCDSSVVSYACWILAGFPLLMAPLSIVIQILYSAAARAVGYCPQLSTRAAQPVTRVRPGHGSGRTLHCWPYLLDLSLSRAALQNRVA